MSDNSKNVLEKAGDKAKELGNSIKESVDNLVHGTAADKREVVEDHGSYDIGPCEVNNSAQCKFVPEKAGNRPEMQHIQGH